MEPIAQKTIVQSTPKSRVGLLKMFLIVGVILLVLCGICTFITVAIKWNSERAFREQFMKYYPGNNISEPKPTITVTPIISQPSTNMLQYGKDASIPSDFPTDVPLFGDAKLNASGYDATKKMFTLNFSIDEYKGSILDFYKKELKAKGWTLNEEGNIYGSFLTAKKDNRELNVFVFGIGSNQNLSLTVTKP